MISPTTSIAAYVPCYNAAASVGLAVKAIQDQTVPVCDIVVVDDGSSDTSADVARAAGARVVRLDKHAGRGAARACAMEECKAELVLCCDATCALDSDFLEQAMPWFQDGRVGAVFGVYRSTHDRTAADRWRSRHLFKAGAYNDVSETASFATYGAVVRRSAVLAAGNYDKRLIHGEDHELDGRLRRSGFKILRVPACHVDSTVSNGAWKTLERYSRWYNGREPMTFRHYLKTISYSLKVMAVQDLEAGDIPSLALTLLCPHAQFLRTLMTRPAEAKTL